MKNVIIGLLMVFAISTDSCREVNKRTGSDSDKAMEKSISNLMNEMTLDEKIGQLNLVSVGFDVTGPIVSEGVAEKIKNGSVGGVFNTYTPSAVRKLQEIAVTQTRLKIPLIFGFDVIHGHRTIFPVPLGLASCWDMETIEKSARIAAEEASAEGLNWTFSPMVDIARDPRWGRICEGSGEDTWYGSLVAAAMVRGYQGDDLSANNTILACVKHYALYGAALGGRDYNTVDMSDQMMMENYLPPYKAAVDAGAGSVMASFNEINGVPATANKWLITELLRNQWGFKGLVVTDYTGINELVPHGVAKDEYEAAMLAMNAGCDMDMVGESFLKNLKQLVNDGKVTEDQIDIACRRILDAKYKLGLFDDPFRYVDETRAEQTVLKKEFRAAAREIASKSMVLLKNNNNTLPLKKEGTIALIGPLVNSRRDLIGSWSGGGREEDAVSVAMGIANVAGKSVKINYAQGSYLTDDTLLLRKMGLQNAGMDKVSSEKMLAEALNAANKSDIIVAVVGESQGMSGEAASRSDIGIPENQLTLLKTLKKTGKPLVIILMNGRPLTLEWEDANADAILETWFAGTEAGNAIADVLFGDFNPSGKLTATFPRNVGQIPLYYNYKNTGRPYTGIEMEKYKSRYLDVSNDPLYPFGYGLSYSAFEYSDLIMSTQTLESGSDSINVSVSVLNSGRYAGEEVAQLYIQDLVGSVTRPVKELKDFKKIFLEPGQKTKVTFTIRETDLRFYNSEMEYKSEPGDFKVFAGTNSRDVLDATFSLK